MVHKNLLYGFEAYKRSPHDTWLHADMFACDDILTGALVPVSTLRNVRRHSEPLCETSNSVRFTQVEGRPLQIHRSAQTPTMTNAATKSIKQQNTGYSPIAPTFPSKFSLKKDRMWRLPNLQAPRLPHPQVEF
jgi:hypothetical protein